MWLVIVGVIVVVGLALGVPKVVAWAQSRDYRYSTSTVPMMDVTLVLGAMMWPTGPSPYLQSRIDLAAKLYKTGKTKVIIVSGSSDPVDDEPAGMKAALVEAGVPADRIVTDDGGIDTYSSCIRARDVYGVHSLIVITQSYHLPRAVATCRMLGIDAVGVGDDTPAHDFRWYKYQVRETLADVKMVLDVVTGRQVPYEAPNDDVQKALAIH